MNTFEYMHISLAPMRQPTGAALAWCSGRNGSILARNTCVATAGRKHWPQQFTGRGKTFYRNFITSHFETKPRFTIIVFCAFIESIRRTKVCRYYTTKQNLALVQIVHAGVETLHISYSLKISNLFYNIYMAKDLLNKYMI